MKRTGIYKFFFAIFVLYTIVGVRTVVAAEYFFESESTRVRPGDSFSVTAVINSEREDLNAFEGEITYPSDLITFSEVRDGTTLITFWVEAVQETEPGVIRFAGITPGGFKGQKGILFELVFVAREDAPSNTKVVVAYKNTLTLLNDGLGTEATVDVETFEAEITSEAGASTVVSQEDTLPPDSFTISRARDPLIFDGEWFVAFATKDKGSGIEYYEIIETQDVSKKIFRKRVRPSENVKWERVNSPYRIKDQTLRSYVFVKAVDRRGNSTIATLTPEHILFSVYRKDVIFGILLLLVIIITVFVWRKRRNRD